MALFEVIQHISVDATDKLEVLSLNRPFNGLYVLQCALKLRVPDEVVAAAISGGEIPRFAIELLVKKENVVVHAASSILHICAINAGLMYGIVYTTYGLDESHTVSANLISQNPMKLELFDVYVKAEYIAPITAANNPPPPVANIKVVNNPQTQVPPVTKQKRVGRGRKRQ